MAWQMSGGDIVAHKAGVSTPPTPTAPLEESESDDDLPDEFGHEDARGEASASVAASADQAGNK